MAFAPVDPLARIVAALVAAFGALDALAVDDPGGGVSLRAVRVTGLAGLLRGEIPLLVLGNRH